MSSASEPAEGNLANAAAAESSRRCFVCLTDEGDPAGPSNNWVNPCPCSLAAHHECMLEFVADCEREHRPLQCPICKSTIQLIQPFDPAIWLSKASHGIMSKLSPCLLALFFIGTTCAGSASYGLAALAVFAGPRDAWRAVLAPDVDHLPWYSRIRPGAIIHLPLVVPVLLFNRIVRSFGLPFYMTHLAVYSALAQVKPQGAVLRWPPHPYWVMAWMPAIRKLYFVTFKDIFGDLERRLEREYRAMQGHTRQNDAAGNDNQDQEQRQAIPADGAPQEEAAQQDVAADNANPEVHPAAAAAAAADAAPAPVAPPPAPAAVPAAAPAQARPNVGEGWADAILGFLGADDDDEWEDIPDDGGHNRPGHRHRRRRRRNRLGNGIQEQIIDIVEEEEVQEEDQQHGQPHQQVDVQRNINDIPSLIDISNSLVRSLLFPGFAFLAGEALRLLLPRSWSHHPRHSKPSGLLQMRWGRSLVGGCLYVVLRDLFRLWVKYKIIQLYPKRKIKDLGRHIPRGSS